MIIFNDTLGVYGGSHTLMVRMCRWLHEHHIRSAVICREKTNKEIVETLRKYHTQIICADLTKIEDGRKIFMNLLCQEEIRVVSFCWNYYLDVERIKKRYQLYFNHIIYCIHPETFKKGIGFRSDILKKYSKKKYYKIYERMNTNRAVVMMDERDLGETEMFFGTHTVRKPEMIRLPMYCNKRNDAESIIKRGFESSLIMTAARADFPYKGYILGLIDDFAELKKEFPTVRLEIISSGDDRFRIEERLAELPDEIRADIELHGWMEYQKLLKKLEECRLFVGMGTSVLDAGLVYKPCIAVQFNTYENLGSHLLSECPTFLTSEPDCTDKAVSLIKSLLNISFSDYREECYKTFDEIKKHYDMDLNMWKLAEKETKYKGSLLSGYESARHAANMLLNNIRYRNKDFNSYSNL